MELGNLPLDGFRPILSMLDLPSLAQLHATNDRRIRNLLSRSGALHTLHIRPFIRYPDRKVKHFLRTVKDVKHLSVARDTDPKLLTATLLQSLNPQSISLHTAFTPYEDPATHASIHRADKEAQRANGPFLRLLAMLPKTLQSLTLHISSFFDLFELFSCLRNFSDLESLTLNGSATTGGHLKPIRLPPKLTTLKFLSWPQLDYKLLALMQLASSQLISITWDFVDDPFATQLFTKPLETFSLDLPPTLQHLSISAHFEYTPMPSHLLSLHLTLSDDDASSQKLFEAVYALRNLIRLSVVQKSLFSHSKTLLLCSKTEYDRHQLINVETPVSEVQTLPSYLYVITSQLPRGLQSLEIRAPSESLSKAAIAGLPSNLNLLVLFAFELDLVPDLRKVAPNCYLSLVMGINLWKSENGLWLTQNEFAPHWRAESFDLVAWQQSVRQWRLVNKVSFSINFRCEPNRVPRLLHFPKGLITLEAASNDGSNLPWEDIISFDLLTKDCPELVQIDINLDSQIKPFAQSLPQSSLTSLDLQNTPLPPNFIDDTGDLEYLVASSFYEPTFKLTDSLTHLDTPNWTFSAQDALNWPMASLNVLKCSITDMPDFEVIPFLRHVSSNCPEVSLSICYHVTGYMLSDPSAAHLQTLTWDSMKTETDAVMRKLLLAPIDTSSHPEGSPSPKSLSSTVASLTQSAEVGRGRAICIPKSAVTVSLNLGTEIYWSSGILKSKDLGAFSTTKFKRVKDTKSKTPSKSKASKRLPGLHDSDSDDDSVTPSLYELPYETTTESGLPRDPPRFGFGFALTDLSLHRITLAQEWLTRLPTTLRSLHFTTMAPLSTLSLVFPPNLAKLVIEMLIESTAAQPLPFKLSSIPASIEYIGISSNFIVPHQEDRKAIPKEEIVPTRLPLLKTFYMSQPSMFMIHLVCSRLEIHPQGRIVARELPETPIKDQRNNPAFGVGNSSHAIVKDLLEREQLVLDQPNGKSLDELLLAEISALSISTPSVLSPSKGFGSFAPSSPISPSSPGSSVTSPFSSTASSAVRRKAVKAPRK